MTVKARVALGWRWALLGSAVTLAFSACGGTVQRGEGKAGAGVGAADLGEDEPFLPGNGATGGKSVGAGGKSTGSGGAGFSVGGKALPGAGGTPIDVLGGAGEGPVTFGGAGGSCREECGGCSTPAFVFKCSSRELVFDPYDRDFRSEVEACAAAQQLSAQGGAGGAAPVAAAGVANSGGLCDSYVARGVTVHACTDGCIQSEYEYRVGECVLDGECCVMLSRWGCGP